MAAPSTAPTPLDESLTKFLGGSGASTLSPNQVTYGSTVPSSNIGYDPNNQFRPQGDILTINAEPGTGASTAETWAHELDVERQKQDALEFEFQQQQEANRLAEEAAALEIARASEARDAGMYGYETQAAKLSNTGAELANQAASTANQLSAYDLLEAQRANERYVNSLKTIEYNNLQNWWLNGSAMTPQNSAEFQKQTSQGYLPAGSTVGNIYYDKPMTYSTYNLSGGYKPIEQYQAPLGLNGKPTQQIYN